MPYLELDGIEFFALAQELLGKGHRVRFSASGESMRPFILDGDLLEVAPVSGRSISVGEVVLIETSPGRLLCHRVVKTKHSGMDLYLIKGDSCKSADGWFELVNILGRVEAVERGTQLINLVSSHERWKAKSWVFLYTHILILTWLPTQFKAFLREKFLRY